MVCIVFALFGCSEETLETGLTLEQRVINLLEENDINYKDIIEYDLKDNYIFVIYQLNEIGNALGVASIENTTDGLELRHNADGSSPVTLIVGEEDAPIVTLYQPRETSNIKEVNVFGKTARKVLYHDNLMEGVTIEKTYWIAYSYIIPDFFEDIEIIEE
ncbi:hypothetical protein AB1K81_08345 [Ornithinibacillus sp. 179-J 7C1 HS]